MKLIAKIIITGKIKSLTGLHIGGSKSSMEIGGVDLNVIKTPDGVPYIPGSSLKGKMRSLLAREEGSMGVSRRDLDDTDKSNRAVKTDEDFPLISNIFGMAGDLSTGSTSILTRLYVRDAFLNTVDFANQFKDVDLELDYSDVKIENNIDRKRGTAVAPRHIERVPSGVKFDFELVYNVFNDNTENSHINQIKKAMRLLQMDYIGGHGSRGYGKITFEQGMKQTRMSMKDFEDGTEGVTTDFKLTAS
jgi:CRISPR-associated protein Csm3